MKSIDAFLSNLRHQDITLWLDGDRLRYRAPEGSLSVDDLAQLRGRKAEVIDFLKVAKQSANEQQLSIEPVSRTSHLPLSFAQQRFWFLYQFEPDSPANNVPVVIRFTGGLNVEALKRSLTTVMQRHEVLRSRFPTVDGQPVLIIEPPSAVDLPIVDLRNVPEVQRNSEAQAFATQAARQPFDLENGPLLRVTLFRLSMQEHLFLWNQPCIICDGTSSDLFYRELTQCYAADVTGTSANLPDLPIQYVDFAAWQRQHLQGERLDSHISYWKQQLGDQLTSIQLPIDYPRASGLRTCRGDRYARMFSKSLHQDLQQLSQQLNTTLFCVLLAVFDALLYRYSNQNDILTTFVSSGRDRVEIENLIGFFSNTLILRTQLDPNLTFKELIQHVHEQNLDAYLHQELPFERLVEALSPEQRQGRSPLFQTKFTLNPPWTNGQGMASVTTLPDLEINSLFGYIYHGKTKYDVILVMREQEQGLGSVIDYNAELFTETTIERMMGHFQVLLESVVSDPNQLIATVPLLTSAEHELLAGWSREQPKLAALSAALRTKFKLEHSGAPIDLVSARILDLNLQIVPVGISGDLYIASSSSDTLDRLNLSDSKVICDPEDPTTRLYNTDFIARYLADGAIGLIEAGDQAPALAMSH